MSGPPEKVTTYGRPSGPFVRVVDKYRLDGDTLYVDRDVYMKAQLGGMTCTVTFKRPSWWRRALAWIKGRIGRP